MIWFHKLKIEATFQNLLGDREAQNCERLSLEERLQIERSIEIKAADRVNLVIHGLSMIKENCLNRKKEIAIYVIKTHKLSELYEGTYPIGPCTIGYLLSWPIALLDGVLPANHLGYVPETAMSLPRKDEVILESFHKARWHLMEKGQFFGEEHKRLVNLYNDLVPIMDSKRPTFMGDRVSKESLLLI